MLLTPLRLSVTAVLLVGSVACVSSAPFPAHGRQALSTVPSLTPPNRIFDAERIAQTGAPTAWDAMRLLVPRHRLDVRAAGPAASGTEGWRVNDPVRLLIDGYRTWDWDRLRSIPARDIVVMHVLTPNEAASFLGESASAGAIILITRASLRQM